jgi:replicative superfamily II helicase
MTYIIKAYRHHRSNILSSRIEWLMFAFNHVEFFKAFNAIELYSQDKKINEIKEFSFKNILNAKNRIINNNKLGKYAKGLYLDFIKNILYILKKEKRKIVYIEFRRF